MIHVNIESNSKIEKYQKISCVVESLVKESNPRYVFVWDDAGCIAGTSLFNLPLSNVRYIDLSSCAGVLGQGWGDIRRNHMEFLLEKKFSPWTENNVVIVFQCYWPERYKDKLLSALEAYCDQNLPKETYLVCATPDFVQFPTD